MLDSTDLIGRMRRVMHEHRVTRYATARTYASPHTGAPSTFQGAEQMVHAPQGGDPGVKGWARHWARAISQHTGLQVRPHTAIGDWAPEGEESGAEPSTEFMFGGARDFDHAKYAAALIGRHSNQIQVLPFMHDPEGPHTLWEMRSNAHPKIIRQTLDRVQLPYRTLVREKGGHRAVIADLGYDPETPMKVKRASEFLGVKPMYTRGHGAFFPDQASGGDVRAAAMPQYDKVIQEFQQRHGLQPFKPTPVPDPLASKSRPAMGGGSGGQLKTAARYSKQRPASNQIGFDWADEQEHVPGNGSVHVLDTHYVPDPNKPRVTIPMEPAKRTGPDATPQDMYNNGLIAAAQRRRDPDEKRELLQMAAGGGKPKPGTQPAQPTADAAQGKRNRPEAVLPPKQLASATNNQPFGPRPGGPYQNTWSTPDEDAAHRQATVEANIAKRQSQASPQPAAPLKPMGNATLTQVPQGRLYPPGMHPAQQPTAPPVQPPPVQGEQFPDLGVFMPKKAKPQPPGIVSRAVSALDSPELAIGASQLAGKAHGKIMDVAGKAGTAITKALSSNQRITPAGQALLGQQPQKGVVDRQGFTAAGRKLMGKPYSRFGDKTRYAGMQQELPKPAGYTPGAATAGQPEYKPQEIKGPLGRSQEFKDSLGKPQANDPSDDAYDVLHNAGHIVVLSRDKKRMHVIDARNPLDDTDLVNFHKTWTGSRNIANKVEQIASQHRRMISADANIHQMPPSPLNAIAGTPAEALMRGRMGAGVIAAHNKANPPAKPAAPAGNFPGRVPNPLAERPVPMAERPWHS